MSSLLLAPHMGLVRPKAAGGAWYPSDLWDANDRFFFDPSDLTSMWTNYYGQTQVSSDADLVGLMLDKGQMGTQTAAAYISGLTDIVDTTNDYTAWTAYGSNTLADPGSGEVEITYVNNANGAQIALDNAGSLTQDFTAGYVMHFTCQIKVNTGSVDLAVSNGGGSVNSNIDITVTSTTYTTIELVVPITATATNAHLYFKNMSAGEVVTIKDIVIKEIPGNHLFQSTDSKRPEYKTSAGLHWLEFDGTSAYHHLKTTDFVNGTWPQPSNIWMALTCQDNGAAQMLYDGIDATNRMLMLVNLSNDYRWYAGSYSDPSSSPALGATAHVMGCTFNGASTNNYVDGAETTDNANNNSLDGFLLGTRYTGSNDPFLGRCYGVIGRETSAFDASERGDIDTWLGAKAGLTL